MMRCKIWKKWAVIALLAAGLGALFIPAEAATIPDSPYVTFSPDGKAWTTNAGDQSWEWYRGDGSDDVETGISSALRQLRIGEHYYRVERRGKVPVGKWTVGVSRVNCCHNGYLSTNEYHGVAFVNQPCLKPHYSGWIAKCADCGDYIETGLIYMSRDAAKTIQYLEMGAGFSYYYLCPFNRNLEQGFDLEKHVCKSISANRYRVEYFANAGADSYSGYMLPSYHMYDNSAEYNGETVMPQTHLSKNSYRRIGWKFLGWNTQADGSGIFYGDEAEILNLCGADYLESKEEGCVKLYAMWERTTSVLEIDPMGGKYMGNPDITAITQGYGSIYELTPEALEPPVGHRVIFVTDGGSAVQDIRGTMHFTGWVQSQEWSGQLLGNQYIFTAPDENADRVFAAYAYDPIELPLPCKENASFGGWYYDERFTMPAGGAGDSLIPERDMTLYAQWVELRLSAVDNYSANGGRGAVDLNWVQADEKNKVYKIYQSTDGKSWERINSAEDISNDLCVEKSYGYVQAEETYKVLHTGFYQLDAWGAQGGDYGSFQGGFGGEAAGRFWLKKGEVLTITVGGQDGYNGGGAGSRYAGGGGCTSVYSDIQGLLLVAGGGGGAAPNGNGNAGGSSQSTLLTDGRGETGVSGGGGGYRGGKAGELILHYHVRGVCNHLHAGRPDRYGGCYTEPVWCGRELSHEYVRSETWYWGGSDTEYCPNCGAVADKGESCSGHEVDYYDHRCPVHNIQESNTSDSEPEYCTAFAGYAPSCGKTEAYICGYRNGEIVSSKSAYGGSSYVNGEAASVYEQREGVRQGDGCFVIKSEDIGYQEEMRLEGVKAEDREGPEDIAWDSVSKTAAGEGAIYVSWERPADRGTAYYHKAESYMTADSKKLCTSNITLNTLVSGIKGYYYCIDGESDTDVDDSAGVFVEEEKILLNLPENAGYLHVRAVDAAGNPGQTLHIPLGSLLGGDDDVSWPLYTRQLNLETGAHVYPAPGEKSFYVKADGMTPFSVQYEAYMQGPATKKYQPCYVVFESGEMGESRAQNRINLPNCEVSDSEIYIEAQELSFETEGCSRLYNDSYTLAIRSQRNRELRVMQKFVLNQESDGKRLEVIPRSGAAFKGGIIWSDQERDAENGLWIIGDGEAPTVSGVEQVENLLLIDRREGEIELSLSAVDELSGVKELQMTILNLDNGAKHEWQSDFSGNINVIITKDEPIFSGDFTITVYAADNVGNEVTLTYDTTEFDLRAEVERILTPHTPVFKQGESGVLHITAWGYPEKVEIEFPPGIAEWDKSLNHTYVYELKQRYRQEEDYVFMVPLRALENEQYSITIRAYKGEKMLELHPTFSIIGVQGTILDEIRTRLR